MSYTHGTFKHPDPKKLEYYLSTCKIGLKEKKQPLTDERRKRNNLNAELKQIEKRIKEDKYNKKDGKFNLKDDKDRLLEIENQLSIINKIIKNFFNAIKNSCCCKRRLNPNTTESLSSSQQKNL